MRKNSLSRNLFLAFDVLVMSAFAIVCLYPMIYVLLASFSDSGALMAHEGLLLKPLGFNFAAYKAVAKNPNIINGYMSLSGSLTNSISYSSKSSVIITE